MAEVGTFAFAKFLALLRRLYVELHLESFDFFTGSSGKEKGTTHEVCSISNGRLFRCYYMDFVHLTSERHIHLRYTPQTTFCLQK